VAERPNAEIQWIKSSRGFGDRDRFKLAILFKCARLTLDAKMRTL
jgi:hypothetical protein